MKYSGRDVFKKSEKVIKVLSLVFSVLPSFILDFIWAISSPFSGVIAIGIRYLIIKSKARFIGDNVYVGKSVTIKNIHNLIIGSNVSIHDGCYIDSIGGVEIVNDTSIAHQSSLVSFEHTWSDERLAIKYNPTVLKKISIGSDVWIGCGVRVLAGTNIEKRSIIAAGSVVKGACDSHSIYAGVPAKKIKDI